MANLEEQKTNAESEQMQWFAMAPIYFQESKVKSYLDQRSIRNYLPMKIAPKSSFGKMELKPSPVVNSLIFIYTTENSLATICKAHPHLHYKYDKTDGKSRKMTVPEKQMEDFIRISSQSEQDVIYFDPQTTNLNLEKGTPIRLHSPNPMLNGIEGHYIKIQGKRDKRLVVSLGGIHAVAMAVDISWIERV